MNINLAQKEFYSRMMNCEKIQDNDPILPFIRDDKIFLINCSKKYPSSVLYANDELKMSYSFISDALKKRPDLILHLPKEHTKNENIADIVLHLNPYLFNIFSSKIRSNPNIYSMVLNKSIQQLRFIPKKTFNSPVFRTTLYSLILRYPELSQYIPTNINLEEILNKLTSLNGDVLLFINKDLITNDLLIKGINSNINCIILLDNALPQIDKLKVLEQSLPILNKFKEDPQIMEYITFFHQETHIKSLNSQLDTINKEEIKIPVKRKI